MPFGTNDEIVEQESTQGFGGNDVAVSDAQPINPQFDYDLVNPTDNPIISDPSDIHAASGEIWDMAVDANIPLNESENVFGVTEPPNPPVSDNLVKRFGKQFFNSSVANVVTAVSTKSAAGKIGTDLNTLAGFREDFFRRAESGEPVTEDEVTRYATSRQVNPATGRVTMKKLDERSFRIFLANKRDELNIRPPISADEVMEQFFGIKQQAEQKRFEETDISAEVSEAGNIPEKLTDAAAGIAGFVAQIAVLKKASPTMPEWLVWENINLANGGKPGHGAAMQLTLGGFSKMIPGTGFIPAVQRGTMASTLFGTTTYLGGGDTVDILINMGIPFAFEGIGMTKQSWAKYKNKQTMIDTIKQKAPSLRNRSNIEIEKSISDLLTNVEMKQKFAPKEGKQLDLSAEVKSHMQRVRYDQLLKKANAGDKKAVKELNDYIQGTNVPTYEQLLERGYNGEADAFTLIQEGRYQGGDFPKAELKIPKTKKAGTDYKPKTKLQKIKDGAKFAANEDSTPGKIDAKTTKKSRERGFITSTKDVLPELKIEGQYIPRATDPLAIKACNLVLDNIGLAEKVRKGTSDKAVATSSELIKHYGEKARAAKTSVEADMFYEKAATVANETAVMLTEAGRTVQAASILGRLTPEGQVRFAAREIQRFNESVTKKKGGLGGLEKKIPELTGKQSEFILKEMGEIAKMAEGKEKFIRFQKLQGHISTLVPTPLYDKLITTWKAGLLTGIKTSGLNIFSNAAHSVTETVKDIPASAIDKAASYFTGKRTVTPNIKGLRKGTIEGAGNGLEYLKTGYSERDIGVKLDYVKANMGKGPLAKALQAYTDTVFRTLGAEDQPFYYAAKLRSMYEQAKVSAINLKLKGKKAQAHVDNLIQNPTENMIKLASMDAETAVYINKTRLGDIARGIQKLPGGEVVVPFGRTPSAVAMQIVNYSPVGAVKTIIANAGKGRFDQRAFSKGLGRSITGTAAMVIGVALYDNGLIALDRPKTEKERKLWELEGRIPNSVKIGDKWRTVQSFGPAGNLLVIGGHFRRAFQETGSPTAAMTEALGGSAKTFTEQTFMRGVSDFAELVTDPERSATFVAGGMVSSIIPTIVSDVARATDTKERKASTIQERVKKRIPGARQTLEPSVNVLGEERGPTANPLELMIDPTRPSKEISTPVIDELRRLWDQGWEVSPNQLGTRDGYDVLTPEENTELWKRAGSLTKDGLSQLIENENYDKLPDDIKADAITQIVSGTQKAAKIEMVVKKLEGIDDKKLTKLIFDLRKSGLADQDIIPIALSKRNPRKILKESK